MILIIKLLYTLLLVLMFWVVFQDFKSRTLNLYVALGILLTSFMLVINTYSLNWIFEIMLYNFLLLLCFYGLLFLFYSIKGISISQVFEDKLGIGDIVFTIAIIPCFTTLNLLSFLLLSFIFSIIIYQALKFLKDFKSATIPLAGNMALFFILTQILMKLGIKEPINALI